MARSGVGHITISDILDGNNGSRGTTHTYAINNGWSDALADFSAGNGTGKIRWDVVTISYPATGFSQTKHWSGAAWVVISQVLDGSLLVNGSIRAAQLDIDDIFSRNITASNVITGAVIQTAQWNDISTDRTVLDTDKVVHYNKGSTVPALTIGQDGDFNIPIVRIGSVLNPVRGLDVYSNVDGAHSNVFLNDGSGTALHITSGIGTGTALSVESGNNSNNSPTMTVNTRGDEAALKVSGLGSNEPLVVEQFNLLAPALKLKTNASQPPMTVNSTVKVANLNADTVDGYHVSTTRNSANTIPVRDSNGYLHLGWINTTSGNTTTGSSDYYVNTNDGYIRKKTLANVRSEILNIATNRSDTTYYDVTWHSGNALYSCTGVEIRSSDGTMRATHFRGGGNVGGTGEAIHCPAGVYSQGTNWLYGQIITNNNAINAGTGALTVGTATAKKLYFKDYGAGVVGTYSPTRFQTVFSMGSAYQLADDGASLGNFYGISWTHSNNTNGNARKVTGHQACFQAGSGTTFAAIGQGGIWSTSNITAYSDIRVKTNIQRIVGALDKIDKIGGYTYDRTDIKTPRQAGVIAQEMLEVLPEVVTGDDKDHYSVAYGNIVALLIEGIKDLHGEVKQLKGLM